MAGGLVFARRVDHQASCRSQLAAIDGRARGRGLDARQRRIRSVRRAVQRVERGAEPGRAGARLRDGVRGDRHSEAELVRSGAVARCPPSHCQRQRRLRGRGGRHLQWRLLDHRRLARPSTGPWGRGRRFAQLGQRVEHVCRGSAGAGAADRQQPGTAPWGKRWQLAGLERQLGRHALAVKPGGSGP